MKEKMTPIEFVKNFQLLLFLAVVVVVMGVMQPKMFFTPNFFINVLLTISVYGIMITGTIFAVLRGSIDLSCARLVALSATILVKYIMEHGRTTSSVFIGAILAIIVCVLIGAVNGVFVELAGMNAMIVTLATQKIIESSNQLYIENRTLILNEPNAFHAIANSKIIGIPSVVWIFAIFVALSYYILNHTTFGRQVYAVGGNSKAARYTGINDKRLGIIVYMISGFTAAIAGIVLASFTQQATYFTAAGYEGYVIIALAVGGVSLQGGSGNILGAVLGAFLLGMINRSLVLLGVNASYHDFVRGLVIIIAIAIDMIDPQLFMAKRAAKKAARQKAAA